MNKRLIAGIMFLSLLVLIGACKKSATNQPPSEVEVDSGYFPDETGSVYEYDINKIDSTGSMLIGSRSTFYAGDSVVANVKYRIQIDTVELAGETSINFSYFRKTDGGVFYYLDTTGLASSVPDSILEFITFDPEIRLLFFPMYDGTNWPAFRISFTQGSLSFIPIEVTASYQGKENIDLPALSLVVEAARIKFTLMVKADPFNPPIIFEAFGWLAKDIGFVKWQGNGTIVSAFTGGGIDFDDTTSVVTQTLTFYAIAE